MAQDSATLTLDEASARRIVLVQAIEAADAQGKLVSPVELELLEKAALQASRDPAHLPGPSPARYLPERAKRVLAVIENRSPRIAALQAASAWQAALPWALPLVALLMGAGLDRIGNPHHVNMLSPPLLAFVFWNLAVYLALILAPVLPQSARARGPISWLRRWLAAAPPAHRAQSRLRASVLAQFRLRWWSAAAALESRRIQLLLHASAAAWAIGVALSIAVGGLMREYRVGWESTWLDAPDVYLFLRALFAPVIALFPWEPFTLAEVERMHFGSAGNPGREQTRHWVALYLALLFVLVVIPRILLAAYAGWRKQALGHTVRLDLNDTYFVEVMARVSPARVMLALLAFDAGARAVLMRVLRQATARPGSVSADTGEPWTVLETARGDELRLLELPAAQAAAAQAAQSQPSGAPRWLGPLQGLWKPPEPGAPDQVFARARSDADIVLALTRTQADLEALEPAAQWLGKPVLVLHDDEEAQRRAPLPRLRASDLPVDVLWFSDVACCWWQEEPLRRAIARRLPAHKAAGAERLMQAWRNQHGALFEQCMRLLAEPLLQAARETREVEAAPLSLRRILSPIERDASQHARVDAMAAAQRRVDRAFARSFGELVQLYGVQAQPTMRRVGETGQADRFVVHEAVDTPQAGMAGAASGAAAGATVDLLTGGLTLGAAAALGALIGGGGALAAAAWKNRAAPTGATVVQLSDEMMLSLTELALLRYLAVVHDGRQRDDLPAQPPLTWHNEVVAAVAADREHLLGLWAQARQAADARDLLPAMAQQLQSSMVKVFLGLYGGPRLDPLFEP